MISPQAWGLAALVTDVASFPLYAVGVWRRRRSPGRVGWVMFGVFYTYLAVASAAAGATWSDLILISEAAGCAWVAWLAIRHGEDDLVRRPGDGWWMLPVRNPVTALCFAWLAVICVTWPALDPAWRLVAGVSVDAVAVGQVVVYSRAHGGESPWSWALYGVAGGLSAGAVTRPWPSVLHLYPAAATVFAACLLAALRAHQRQPAARKSIIEESSTRAPVTEVAAE